MKLCLKAMMMNLRYQSSNSLYLKRNCKTAPEYISSKTDIIHASASYFVNFTFNTFFSLNVPLNIKELYKNLRLY